jgi:uncharacterized membrane protein YeiH
VTHAPSLLAVLDHVGVGVFAMSGVLAAGRKRLDWMGVLVVAVVTAVGGGTLRDVLLGRYPIFWVAEPSYVMVTLVAAAFTVVLTRFRRPPLDLLLVADALGLALFTVSGAQIAEAGTRSGTVIILMGSITGAAGGALRDVLCNEIPLILRSGPLYATAALAGAAVYFVLATQGVPRALAAGAGMIAVAAVRLGSIFLGLRLPVYELKEEPAGGAPSRPHPFT